MSSVLAIDPGYDRIGIAAFDGDTLKHSECFIPETKNFSARLEATSARIHELTHEF